MEFTSFTLQKENRLEVKKTRNKNKRKKTFISDNIKTLIQYLYLSAKKNKKTYFPFFLKHDLVRNHDFVQKTLAAGLRKRLTDGPPYLSLLLDMRWYSEGVMPVKALKVTMNDERALNPTLLEIASKV